MSHTPGGEASHQISAHSVDVFAMVVGALGRSAVAVAHSGSSRFSSGELWASVFRTDLSIYEQRC
jgi:hypothetical protein